ncbi:MAG: hypothetical protein ACRCZP_10845, partial [Phycicoccus sp.]
MLTVLDAAGVLTVLGAAGVLTALGAAAGRAVGSAPAESGSVVCRVIRAPPRRSRSAVRRWALVR